MMINGSSEAYLMQQNLYVLLLSEQRKTSRESLLILLPFPAL